MMYPICKLLSLFGLKKNVETENYDPHLIWISSGLFKSLSNNFIMCEAHIIPGGPSN